MIFDLNGRVTLAHYGLREGVLGCSLRGLAAVPPWKAMEARKE